MAAKKNQIIKPVDEVAEEMIMDDPNAVTAEEAQATEVPVEPVEKVEEAKAPVEAPKASGKFSDHLKATLAKHPHINCAWVNEKGEWHYSAKAGFKAYSREEILNG